MSITFYVGWNGYGKTHAAVQYGVLPAWEAGRAVVSNITLYPEEGGFDESLYRPLSDWSEIPRLGRHQKRVCGGCGWRVRAEACRRCGGTPIDVPKLHPDGGLWSITANEGVGLLLDEVTAVLPARDAVNVPPELQRMLNQFRKPDIAPVSFTAPAWARLDLMAREVVTTVVESQPVLVGLLSKRLGDGGSTWLEHRVFRRYWFDAMSYEEATVRGSEGLLKPQRTRWLISQRKRHLVNRLYDTLEGVDLMDHIACGVCGGKYRRKTCDSPDSHREFMRAERRKEAAALLGDNLELAAVDTTEEQRILDQVEEVKALEVARW